MAFEMTFDPEIADKIRRWRANVEDTPDGESIPLFVEGVQVGHVERGELDAAGNLVCTFKMYPVPGPMVPIEGRA